MKHDRRTQIGMDIGVTPRPRTDDETIHATTGMICRQAQKDPLFADAVVNAAAWIIANSARQTGAGNLDQALAPFRQAVEANQELATDRGPS